MAELDQREERWLRAAKLAGEIIDESRVQLMLKFRFLDLALWRMPAEPIHQQPRYPVATDGKTLLFEPYGLLARFEQSFDELVRDYLHLIMHCVFRHPWDEAHPRADAWWLACDIVAESVSMELCASRFESELDVDRKAALSELRMKCAGDLSPARLYALFLDSLKGPESPQYNGISQSKMNEYRALFERDEHEAWPAYAKQQGEEEPGDIEELAEQDDDAEGEAPASEKPEMQLDGDAESESDERQQLQDADSPDSSDDGEEEAQQASDEAQDAGEDAEESEESTDAEWQGMSSQLDHEREVDDEKSEDERDWEEIAKQIEMNLDTFSKEWGDEAGSLIASLRVANRKRYDYSEFLRRFTMLSEEMKINDDEYDYVFYTYGLELYGNMPLVEPLEYKETQRIRDFVIAIDTSESCEGDLVRRFVEHTFDIMKRQEDYAHAVNIHVIQCDAKVQADTRITDLRDVDDFMEGFFVRGLGGTDFRPVFSYVEDLRTRGELADMKGLIYFTDGYGRFPEASPDYDTAFVFMDTADHVTPSVPPWAMKVVLDEEGINRLASRM